MPTVSNCAQKLKHDRSDTEGLPRFYETGRGVAQDPVEAAQWYRKAAEQGYGPAQNNLGVFYRSGIGVPNNLVEAYKWLTLSAAQGIEEAKVTLRDLASHMTSEQIAEGKRLSQEFQARPMPPPRNSQ